MVSNINQAYYNQIRKQRGCEKLGITEGQWAYIKRVGTMLENLYAEECNGYGQPAFEVKWERIAKKFATDNKLNIYLQSDPRGACIYLDTKPIQENRYTNAVCIY